MARLLSYMVVFVLGFSACALVVNRLPPNQGTPVVVAGGASLATYRAARPAPAGGDRYSVADAVARVEPAVVNIYTAGRSRQRENWEQLWLRHWFGRPLPPQDDGPVHGVASGVIVSPDGYILTNNHVVDDADRISVMLPDRRRFDGQVVGTDQDDDLAVVKIDGHDLPIAAMGDSSRLRVGEWVIAIGNPLGFESTVTVGVVSAERRDPFTVEGKTLRHVIQTDAAINQGNSGGALVNLSGELIGLNTAIVSTSVAGGSIGIGFAIPSNDARPVVEQLIRYRRVILPWIGIAYAQAPAHGGAGQITAESMPGEAAAPRAGAGEGVVVTRVAPSSPASTIGLHPGDVIRRLGSTPVGTTDDMYAFVHSHSPGQHLRISIRRRGKPMTFLLRLGERPRDASRFLPQ